MKIRIIGLGKMGLNMALNMKDHSHQVVGYDSSEEARVNAENSGIETKATLSELLERDQNERLILWLLIPNQIVDHVLEQCTTFLLSDDIIVDAGNSNFNVSIRRYHNFKGRHINFIDLGVSGGIDGARNGGCFMVGGDQEIVLFLESIFHDLTVEDGYAYIGKPGSGHFLKMVHNGIEYGMMQAIGEGFDLLEASPFELDFERIANIWNHGSLIQSPLMGHVHQAFTHDPKLDQIEGRIDDSGEGMWMVEEALKYKVSLPVITQALYARFKSRDHKRISEKVVAAIRKEFGGHAVYKKK
ncbi:MAG: decarboxylating 6-phosphogluconate dehydrogenase [Acholeplasmataceae bacterium]|nr:decarboxylating 6-phosphogluconate dehydrogenase [Acholeplasmataceae bacterium]